MTRRLLFATLIVLVALASNHQVLTTGGPNQRSQQCTACIPKERPSGSIKGYVLDSRGNPMVGATVHARKTDFEKGLLPSTTTDVEGYFLLEGLEPGEYVVYAGKASQGYPEDLAALYSDSVSRSNTIVNGSSGSDLVLKLRQPLGQLTGRIVDIRTRRAIRFASITVRSIENPSNYLETGPDEKGRFRLLRPRIPFNLTISASGYRTWTGGGRGTSAIGTVWGGARGKKLIALRPTKD
ncbi:MAG: large repetitive protein [Blastocatellia bacterium]|jgi:hypothetical protein|nr:large repetitive protein [Blastocatellia bacterium]